MVQINETIFCDGCGTEITISPIARNNQVFCCEDCSQGFECECGKRMELIEEE